MYDCGFTSYFKVCREFVGVSRHTTKQSAMLSGGNKSKDKARLSL